jgi:elongator complex protein 1
MRNIRNTRRLTSNFLSEELGRPVAAWDSQTGDLICACGPSPSSSSVQIFRISGTSWKDDHKAIASWDVPTSTTNGDVEEIISLQHFGDTKSCFVVLKGGDLVVTREEPFPGEEAIEIVATVDDGILAASWSPDEEILAIFTGQFSLVLMSRDFEPIADVKISLDDHKISNHVSVGWGKVETQFKGKRAKALRDPTVPEHVDEGSLSEQDDGRVEISWRGDGEYLALNSIDDDKRRTIRVFSRTGNLDSVSEPVDGLEAALSWRPAGNLIASIKRLNGIAEVVFFERNGLRHGGFTLRLIADDLKEYGSAIGLYWNTDSTVLAVSFADRVQLWTMGNYHYYLKQTVRLQGKATRHVDVRWSSDKPLVVAFTQPGKRICECQGRR